jgi:hypothetical protein
MPTDYGEIGKGAVGGAVTGGAIGSVIPGVGTAIGAGAGGLIGGGLAYLGQRGGGNPYKELDPEGRLGLEAQRASRFAQHGRSNYDDMTQRGNVQLDRLQQRAEGQGLVSSEILRQGLDQNVAAQQGMAAGARPGNQLAATRAAQLGAAQMGAGLAGQQAVAGAQESLGAEQQIGGLIQGMRGQDVNVALGSNANAIQGYGTLEQQRTQRFGAVEGKPSFGDKMMGMASGAASLYAKSDARQKTAIQRIGAAAGRY